MSRKQILIVEDDPAIRMALEDDFTLEGYRVRTASNGKEGLAMGLEKLDHIILLDVMMPEMDGIEVLRELRMKGVETPVIMLTAKSQEIDRVVGLEVGADDYVTKPFSPRELQARVKAVLRRSNHENKDAYSFGTVRMDVEAHQVYKGSTPIKLTALEFELLKYFVEHRGKAITRESLLYAVWGKEVVVDFRTVDTHVANLRKKVEDDPSEPKHILGIRGVGYKFVI